MKYIFCCLLTVFCRLHLASVCTTTQVHCSPFQKAAAFLFLGVWLVMDVNVADALLAEWIDMSLAVEEVVVDDTSEIPDRPQSTPGPAFPPSSSSTTSGGEVSADRESLAACSEPSSTGAATPSPPAKDAVPRRRRVKHVQLNAKQKADL